MTRRSVGLQSSAGRGAVLVLAGTIAALLFVPGRLAAQQQTVHQSVTLHATVVPVSELVAVSPLRPRATGAEGYSLSGTVGVLSNQPFRLEVRLATAESSVRARTADGAITPLTADGWTPVARGSAGLDVASDVEYYVGKDGGRPALPQLVYRIVPDTQPESLALSR